MPVHVSSSVSHLYHSPYLIYTILHISGHNGLLGSFTSAADGTSSSMISRSSDISQHSSLYLSSSSVGDDDIGRGRYIGDSSTESVDIPDVKTFESPNFRSVTSMSTHTPSSFGASFSSSFVSPPPFTPLGRSDSRSSFGSISSGQYNLSYTPYHHIPYSESSYPILGIIVYHTL